MDVPRLHSTGTGRVDSVVAHTGVSTVVVAETASGGVVVVAVEAGAESLVTSNTSTIAISVRGIRDTGVVVTRSAGAVVGHVGLVGVCRVLVGIDAPVPDGFEDVVETGSEEGTESGTEP